MDIGFVGTGHVGLVSGGCFADLGHSVICVDSDEEKIEKLERNIIPIYEPGLEELVERNRKEGRLSFTTEIEEAVRVCEVIFITVGTPPKPDGEADLSSIEKVSTRIAETMERYTLVVEKSTVPVQTGAWIRRTMEAANRRGIPFDVACNPEFLSEGSAISDFMKRDRVVIGVDSERVEKILVDLYRPLGATIVVTDIESAELIKHASSAFLATKISFINAVSVVCEKAGADVVKVAEGMGYDHRIGRDFLNAGVGFGGSCLPKDLRAFSKISEKLGYRFSLLKEVQGINEDQKRRIAQKVVEELGSLKGKMVGVLGLSFKPNTDDVRESSSIDVITLLQKEGAVVKAYDPKAMERAKEVLKDVSFCKGPYEVAEGSEALLLLTEWDEFRELDLTKLKDLMGRAVLIDGRNVFDPTQMKALGFTYRGVGR